jgi:hypothetical protein
MNFIKLLMICFLTFHSINLTAQNSTNQELSLQTIQNGNSVYPPSYSFMKVLQRSGYLFHPDTQQYLQINKAPQFHLLTTYYTIQRNGTSCSLATAATILNAIRELKKGKHIDCPATQNEILEMVNDPVWDLATTDDGPGVSLEQYAQFLEKMFKAYKIDDYIVEVVHVEDKSEKTSQLLRNDLLALNNAQEVSTFLIVNFEQSMLINSQTPVGHMSPVGGYDPQRNIVLILDVDIDWTGPYWVTKEMLLNAMNTFNEDEASQEPVYRGYIRITKKGK